jgi:hypothetical protein
MIKAACATAQTVGGMRRPRHLSKFEAQRSAGELHLICDLNDGPKRHTPERYGLATALRVEMDTVVMVAMVRTNHSQAGKSAFDRFSLPDNRYVTPDPISKWLAVLKASY